MILDMPLMLLKLKLELGWDAEENFETGYCKTIHWYLNKYNLR